MSKVTSDRDKMVATTSERLQSPFLKAYINALRSHLAPESDLSAAGKAIFVSTNLQRGIPMKTFAEYINVRLYSIADSVQSGGPVFSEAEGSYVDFLKEYVESVQESSKPDSARVEIAEEQYRRAKQEASMQLELATYRFRTVADLDKSALFEDFLKKHGIDYRDACEERDAARAKVKELQTTSAADVKKARGMLNIALNSVNVVPGTSMACATEDVDDRALRTNIERPSSVNFRPQHTLEGFDFTGHIWRDLGLGDQLKQSRVDVNLRHGFDRVTWAELGFPDISDRVSGFASPIPDKQKTAIFNVLSNWHMYIQYTGLHAFDITRGDWNIKNFRDYLPELASSAPSHLRAKIFRTTRILLAYNVDLVLQLPIATFETLFPTKDNPKLTPKLSKLDHTEAQLLGDLLKAFPLAKHSLKPNDDMGELHVRVGRNDLYPSLVAVLARVC